MTKIIPIRFSDMEKVRKMIEYVSPKISSDKMGEEAFMYFPFNGLHDVLPLGLKFLQECYVAVEGNELLGMISLAPDGNQKTRWKINRLILNPDAYDIGKQLVDYVVNKYGGTGVETFLTTINENYAEALALFHTACSFRTCSKINIWELENSSLNLEGATEISLKPAENSDAKKLYGLDCEALYPKFKTTLVKTEKDFLFNSLNKFLNRMKGNQVEHFWLENSARNSAEGLVGISTKDKNNFWVDITLSLAYQEYYKDILNFAIKKILSQNPQAKIFTGVKNFHQANKKMTEVLAESGFVQTTNFEILVKDYWRPAEYASDKKSPIMIFPDMTSPACRYINKKPL